MELQKHQTEATLLRPLERIFNSHYFAHESDKEIARELQECNKWKDMIEGAIERKQE